MSKFNLSQWSDLIRGVADDTVVREMLRELEGDAAARRSVDLLERVRQVAERDRSLDIPSYALRVAKAAASVARLETSSGAEDSTRSSAWRFLPFELIFDSLRQPAMAGTRNSPASSRHLSFQAEDYTIDVRLEQDVQGVALTGQLLRTAGTVPVSETPVLVLAGGQIVERSLTSTFGEFQAEGLPEEDLKLYVLTQLGSCIAIPLPGS